MTKHSLTTITISKQKQVTNINKKTSKMIKQALLILAIALTYFNPSWAQKKTISNVVSIQLKNIGPILTESEVTGYYLFYQTDKLSKKAYSYEFEILDQNLNQLSSIMIQGSKYMSLVDAVYNNHSLLLKLYDAKNKEVSFTQYDNKAKEISKTVRKASSIEIMAIDQADQNKQGQNVSMFPINKVGFVDYQSKKNKKYGYFIDFYPSHKDGKKWRVSSDPKSKTHEFPTFIYGDENIIINSVMKKSSIMSKSVGMSLLAINTKTGEKMYEKVFTDSNYETLVLNGLEGDKDGNVYLFGNYYPKGKNELSSPSLGLFAAKLDNKGNVIEKSFISWAEDVSKFVDVNEKGKMKNVGYIFFHDFVRNADGNVFAIGEQYKKQINVTTTDMVVEDIIIFELNKDHQLQKVNIVGKEKSRINLPQGMWINGAQILSYYLKYIGGFDYEFIQFNKDRSIFSVGYVDYVKVKGAANKYSYGSITYTDGQPTEDAVDLMTVKEKKKIKVLPAKIGNIVILEYLPKEKSLKMRMEKLNY
tara:strand:- start:598 stop:2190 length:1593 start_codon:yes stop_codon:yes gene_type:complete